MTLGKRATLWLTHQPHAGDARRPVEPDRHPRHHVRKPPPLSRAAAAVRGRHRFQLRRLTEAGLLSRREDPTHKQKAIYSLAEPAIALVPLLAHIGAWGCRCTPASAELSIRAQLLSDGGPRLWDALELCALHAGGPAPRRSVLAELQAGYEKVVAKKRPAGR
jgi:hypothetical protein